MSNFLELWDAKKTKLFITMPEGGDAIRIMTTHKAKGLKFETVIVDLANRSYRKGKSEFYTTLSLEQFPELNVCLLPVTDDLERIGMKHISEEEKEKTHLDFLNLVYVAFTRAVSALIIIGHSGGKRKDNFTELLSIYLEQIGQLKKEEEVFFSRGALKPPVHKEESHESNKLELKEMISTP